MNRGFQIYSAVRGLSAILWLVLAVIGGFVYGVYWIIKELLLESQYREKYGAVWKAKFEQYHSPLAHVHSQMVICAVCLLALIAVLVWAYRQLLRGKGREPSTGSGSKSRRHRFSSHLDRIIYYRRNALLGIVFGLAGIMASVLLVLFPIGIFTDWRNDLAFAVLVFGCGYGGVIAGCWWWLKAKEWNQDVVFIGLLPLALLFVPFVRLILLANPSILIAGMAMMSLILIVVVKMLPDKSEAGQKKPRWERD